jgi:hypothetical protein
VLQEGTGADLIAAIREAPRALTFISVPWSMPERRARQVFRVAASRLEEMGPELGIRFFILAVDEDEASQHWLASIGLPQFASAGAGSIVWSERDRVISSEISASAIGSAGIIARTMSLWRGPSEPSVAKDAACREK